MKIQKVAQAPGRQKSLTSEISKALADLQVGETIEIDPEGLTLNNVRGRVYEAAATVKTVVTTTANDGKLYVTRQA